jgi:WbqC-like protein family
LFRNAGITVRYDDYHHPTYRQVHPGFEPYMAALDLLFNAGPNSLEILLNKRV